MIPKLIHQIWIQGEDMLRPKDKNKIEAIKLLNPDFTHIVWGEKEIIPLLDKYPKLKQLYMNVDKLKKENKVNPLANKSDIARWVILYEMGGCYMDVDISCINSIDVIIHNMPKKSQILAAPTWNFKFLPGILYPSGSFTICTPKHPLLTTTFMYALKALTNRELGKSLHRAFMEAVDNGREDIYIIPESEVSCYHCGRASICMIPIDIGSSSSWNLRFYTWWCDNKELIWITIILLLLIALWYVWKYRRCCLECNIQK